MIQVGAPRITETNRRVRVSFRLRAPAWVGLQQDELVLDYPDTHRPSDGLGEAAVLSLLPFAFWVGAHLRLDPSLAVSRRVRENAGHLGRLWGEWYGRPFDVQLLGGATAADGVSAAGKTALFFSGGVDSLATFLRHRDEIDSLVFVRGSDLYLRPERLDVEAKYQSILSRLQAFAQAEGREFLVITINTRELFGFRFRGEIWHYLAHCPATVAPAAALSDRYSHWMISSNGLGKNESVVKTGTHVEVVRRLTTGRMTVTIPDTAVTKYERHQLIAAHREALALVRVCSEETAAYNCGRCKKCCHAMAGLLLSGVQPGEAPFPPEAFSYDHIVRHLPDFAKYTVGVPMLWREILTALDSTPELPPDGRQLAELLRGRLTVYERRLQGAPPGDHHRLLARLPLRPNLAQRLMGFPALNHGSFWKWLKQGARARFGRRRLRRIFGRRPKRDAPAHLS